VKSQPRCDDLRIYPSARAAKLQPLPDRHFRAKNFSINRIKYIVTVLVTMGRSAD
jgi:hypothetical protein